MTVHEIIQRAEDFCKDHKVDKHPVEIVAICNNLGIEVFEDKLPLDVSGFIVAGADQIEQEYAHAFAKYNAQNYIVINNRDSASRKRFTIAHELAHFILHRTNDKELYAHRDAGRNGGIETEANLFASNILMPQKMVLDVLDNLGSYIPFSIKAECIAAEFAVSFDAARVRLSQLGIT